MTAFSFTSLIKRGALLEGWVTVLAPAFKVSTPTIERIDPTAPLWDRQIRKL